MPNADSDFQPAAFLKREASLSAEPLIVTEHRDPGIVAFEIAVVSFFLDAAETLGVPKSVAAIYGVCFASAKPLSFADINARLHISQGSISQGLRVLREVGALKVIGNHDRREYFAPDVELRKVASHFIEHRLERQLKAGNQRLQAMKAAVPNGDEGATRELKARLQFLQTWHDKSRALVPIVKTFLKLT